MDCSLIQEDLVAYHLGAAPDDARDAVDAHLLGCTECLRVYLRLKRHLERGDRPSDAARKKLRDAVLAEFRPTSRARAVALLRGPRPLEQGLAVAAVMVLVAAVVPTLASRAERASQRDRAASAERIDTSRTGPESLTFY